LPDPLWYPDLVGDIFAPGLLRHQNTARSTLAKEYTRKVNKEWQALMMFLIRQVAPAAKQLIERDSIRGNAAETLDELVELFNDHFGEPDDKPQVIDYFRPTTNTGSKSPGGGSKKDDDTNDDEKRERYRRHVAIKVRDEVYYLYRGHTLHPHIFAQVSPSNPKMIFVNVRGGYKALPDQKAARREHCLMQVLMAIGKSKYDTDSQKAIIFANEIRSEFIEK
jgi:hypothetical protein